MPGKRVQFDDETWLLLVKGRNRFVHLREGLAIEARPGG